MKKLFSTSEYKRFNKRHSLRVLRRMSGRKKKARQNMLKKRQRKMERFYRYAMKAPSDFRFLSNTAECADFFQKIRMKRNHYLRNGQRMVIINLNRVTQIDFSAVMTLAAICEELHCERINVNGNFPKDVACRKFLIDSGFLNQKYDEFSHLYTLQSKTEFMSLERGQEKLRLDDLKNISNLVLHISGHLLGQEEENLNLVTLLKEICGNSVEWGDAYKRQWTMAVKFEERKVVLVAVDLGQGILNSLYRKFSDKLKDAFMQKEDWQILERAFDRKYGSASRDTNRNKGLPSIKKANEEGVIKGLSVVTNNVCLSFDNSGKRLTFAESKMAFLGTLYQFEIDETCIK